MQQLVAVINNRNTNHQQVPWPGYATCICSHSHMHMHIWHICKRCFAGALFPPPPVLQYPSRGQLRPNMYWRSRSSHLQCPVTDLTALNGHHQANASWNSWVLGCWDGVKPLNGSFLVGHDSRIVIPGDWFALRALITHCARL